MKANAFKDVQSGDWFLGAVSTAYKAGLINGYEDGTFRPNDNITREQMVAMMIRAMKLGGKEIQANTALMNHTSPDQVKEGFMKEMSQNSAWSSLDAVKQNRVEVLPADLFGSNPGTRVTESLDILHKLLLAVK